MTESAIGERALTLLREQGYCVIERVVPTDLLASIREGLKRLPSTRMELDELGRNPFEGRRTARVFNLLGELRAMDALAEHPRVMALCNQLLPENYLLSAALATSLLPGELEQPLHYEDAFYGMKRPHPPVGVNTIWALDPFTKHNGATLVIPQSHRWANGRPVPGSPVRSLCMPAGSVALLLGTLWHAAGANRTMRARAAVAIRYCAPWARQQENLSLAVPRSVACDLSPRLQQLLGYSIHPPYMGHVDGRHPRAILKARHQDPVSLPGRGRASVPVRARMRARVMGFTVRHEGALLDRAQIGRAGEPPEPRTVEPLRLDSTRSLLVVALTRLREAQL